MKRILLFVCLLLGILLLILAKTDDNTSSEIENTSVSTSAQHRSNNNAPPFVPERKTRTKATRDQFMAAFGIDDVDLRNYELESLLRKASRDELETVRSLFESELDDSRYMREWEHFLKWWVDFAPEDALLYAASDFSNDHWEAKHLAGTVAAEKWLKLDPDAAASYFHELPAGPVRDNIMAGFGQEYAIKDLEASLRWAESSKDSGFRAAALFGVTYGVLRAGVHDDFKPDVIARATEFLESHAHEPYAANALGTWVEHVVREDAAQAAEWVNWVVDLPEGTARNAALRSFFENASTSTPESLTKWLGQVEDGPALDHAAAGYIKATLASDEANDPAKLNYLKRLSSSIKDENLKKQSLDQLSSYGNSTPDAE